MAFLTPALIGVSLIFKTSGIRAGVKKGPVEKGPIRYIKNINEQRMSNTIKIQVVHPGYQSESVTYYFYVSVLICL